MSDRYIETYHKTAEGVWDPNKSHEKDYETLRALRLFQAIDADILDERYILARHCKDSDIWAVIGPDGQIAYETGRK